MGAERFVSDPRADELSGALIDGRYRLFARCGQGTQGVVYRARHLGLERWVALKLLPLSADAIPEATEAAEARFRTEAAALGRLRHPNIVAVTDFGFDRTTARPYLAMEWLEGETLADRLGRGALAPADALPVLATIAEALDAAHRTGIFHRDLKPTNVALATGEVPVKVLDFGLAKLALHFEADGADGTDGTDGADRPRDLAGAPQATTTLGTPHYLAPELLRGEPASRASDLYALAALAYETLAGEPPFRGTLAEVIAGHLESEPPAHPRLGPEVLAVLRRGLHKEPNSRFGAARDFVHDLAQATSAPLRRKARGDRRRRRVGASALLLAGLLGLSLRLSESMPEPLAALERVGFDLRARLLPPRTPDPRLLLVTLEEDDDSLTPTPSLVGRADEIATACELLLAAGARGVAFDLLLPAQWGGSEAFVRLLAAHPDALVLAAHSTPDGRVIGPEAISGLAAVALDPRGLKNLFGFANVDEDSDGRVRRGRLTYRDVRGEMAPSWAALVASKLDSAAFSRRAFPRDRATVGGTFWLDPRLDTAEYPTLAWTEVVRRLDVDPNVFRDRLILLGVGGGGQAPAADDLHRVTRRAGGTRALAGLDLQARLIDTITAGLPVRAAPAASSAWAPRLLGAAVGLWVLWARRLRWALLLALAVAGLWLGAATIGFVVALRVIEIVTPLAVLALATALALVLRVGFVRPKTSFELESTS